MKTKAAPPPQIVLGLGNPGGEYEQTRHNAGFWFVDLLARQHNAAFAMKRKFSAAAATVHGGFLLPVNPMNPANQKNQNHCNYSNRKPL